MTSLIRRTQMLRCIVHTGGTRGFGVSATRQKVLNKEKGPVYAAKHVLKTVDWKVSDRLVGGIEIRCEFLEIVVQKTREMTGSHTLMLDKGGLILCLARSI